MGLMDKPVCDLEYKPVGTFFEVDSNTKLPIKPSAGSGLAMGKVGSHVMDSGSVKNGSGGLVGLDGGSIFAGLHAP